MLTTATKIIMNGKYIITPEVLDQNPPALKTITLGTQPRPPPPYS